MPFSASISALRSPRFIREVLTFGAVGLAGFVVDVGLFNALRYAGPGVLEEKPLTAKVISVLIATVVTYAGNRAITWRDRSLGKRSRELVLFFVLNGAGMAIAIGCLAISHYVLGLTSPLADNISANGVGLVLGTVFRFWSYRTLVFRDRADHALPVPQNESRVGQADDGAADSIVQSRAAPAEGFGPSLG